MTDAARVFPDTQWVDVDPQAAGFDPDQLGAARRWLSDQAEGRPYRTAIVRGGRLVAQWCDQIEADETVWLASASKSVYSTMLGIAIAEGMVGSADDKVIDYFPEMMDIPDGAGPKPGRFSREKDRDITFRHLISNTSGWLKPNEEPGRVFHYQTFGMNLVCHAIATRYGYYDSRDPQRLPGFAALVAEKCTGAIGATLEFGSGNFDHPPEARVNIFGNSLGMKATTGDMARLGLLWLRRGRWGDSQIVPAAWIDEITRVATAIREHEPQSNWLYGMGFWTNDCGVMWPDLPTDSFAAVGAGQQLIWVCPSLDLVVVESPGLFDKAGHENIGLLAKIVTAVKD